MSAADLLVVEDVWGPAFEALRYRLSIDYEPQLWTDRAALVERARGYRGIVVRNRTQVDAELLSQLPDLQVVARAGVGLDNIDLAAADRAGVVVTAARGANAQSVAELSLALALALARNLLVHDRATRAGSWQRTAGIELTGRTWGLLGAGATGQAVGRLVSPLCGRVLGYDTTLAGDDPRIRAAGVELVSLDRVIEESDVISVHLPATPATSGLVDRAFLRRMRPGALLINVGRGEVVDEAALAEALQDGHLGGAGLDVRVSEPPTPGLLETLDKVVVTPHIAGITREGQERVVSVLACDLEKLFAGEIADNAVGAVTRFVDTGDHAPAKEGVGRG